MLKVIGVTGKAGSGKSTVCRILEERGGTLVDADKISRDITQKGLPVFDEIIKYFGKEVLDESGEIDRKRLGEIVFSSKAKLLVLNDITHRYIQQRIQETILLLNVPKAKGFIVVDAAIPLEEGFRDVSDVVWTITSDDESRILRLIKRDGIPREIAENIIESQKKYDKLYDLSDVVIYNDGDMEKLRAKIKKALDKAGVVYEKSSRQK